MAVYEDIERLIQFGLNKKMISVWDVDYVRNQLFRVMELTGKGPVRINDAVALESPVPVLERLLDDAAARGVLEEDTTTDRDLFDTKLMDCLMPRPSEVIRDFYHKFEKEGPEAATDYFYQLSQDAHYIRTDRIAKNKHWYSATEYGNLEITINLSKPEKDPKAIAAAKLHRRRKRTHPVCCVRRTSAMQEGSIIRRAITTASFRSIWKESIGSCSIRRMCITTSMPSSSRVTTGR